MAGALQGMWMQDCPRGPHYVHDSILTGWSSSGLDESGLIFPLRTIGLNSTILKFISLSLECSIHFLKKQQKTSGTGFKSLLDLICTSFPGLVCSGLRKLQSSICRHHFHTIKPSDCFAIWPHFQYLLPTPFPPPCNSPALKCSLQKEYRPQQASALP